MTATTNQAVSVLRDETALNDAAWKFLDNAPDGGIPPVLHNNLKAALWPAIECYIKAAAPATIQHDGFTPMEKRGTKIFLGGEAGGGFDVRNCHEAEKLAAFIVASCNSPAAPVQAAPVEPSASDMLKLIRDTAPEVKASELPPLTDAIVAMEPPVLTNEGRATNEDEFGFYYDGYREGFYAARRAAYYLARDAMLAARSPVAAPQPDKMGTGEWTSADDTYMLKREIHNLKRHIEDYCKPQPDVSARDAKQLAQWLLRDPDGEKLTFAGPLESFGIGLSQVKMMAANGTEWTLVAGLREGYKPEAERNANLLRIVKDELSQPAAPESAEPSADGLRVVETVDDEGRSSFHNEFAPSDADIEQQVRDCGGRWNGDVWVIEDADLHPMCRSFLATSSAAKGEA